MGAEVFNLIGQVVSVSEVTWWKAHGTGNDFYCWAPGLSFTPTGQLVLNEFCQLSAAEISQLTDRHFGFGADGVIRALPVRQESLDLLVQPQWQNQIISAQDWVEYFAPQAGEGWLWLMDYHNADGSIAQMCGNGVRAFTHFLAHFLSDGHFSSSSAGWQIATRAGVKTVKTMAVSTGEMVTGEAVGSAAPWYQVDLGSGIVASLAQREVQIPGLPASYLGVEATMGNPHLVVFLSDEEELRSIVFPTVDPDRAGIAPVITPKPVAGVNLEVVVVYPEQQQIKMRVCERGVGETLSCGTGCAAVAMAASAKYPQVDNWTIEIPGGEVQVRLQPSEVDSTLDRQMDWASGRNADLKEKVAGDASKIGWQVSLLGPAKLIGKCVFFK